jgi:hypothetical protein
MPLKSRDIRQPEYVSDGTFQLVAIDLEIEFEPQFDCRLSRFVISLILGQLVSSKALHFHRPFLTASALEIWARR